MRKNVSRILICTFLLSLSMIFNVFAAEDLTNYYNKASGRISLGSNTVSVDGSEFSKGSIACTINGKTYMLTQSAITAIKTAGNESDAKGIAGHTAKTVVDELKNKSNDLLNPLQDVKIDMEGVKGHFTGPLAIINFLISSVVWLGWMFFLLVEIVNGLVITIEPIKGFFIDADGKCVDGRVPKGDK